MSQSRQKQPDIKPDPDFASRASFFELCKCLQNILLKRGKNAGSVRKEKLAEYMKEWRSTGGDFHPALRLMLPHLDKARSSYGMKEKMLAKAYIEVLGLAPNSPDADSLLNYKNPAKSIQATAGDFPGVLYHVLKGRSSVEGRSTVSVADVNEQLELLNSSQDKDERKEILQWFFKNCTPMEQTWIARIILKELKLGISEKTILNLWHPDGVEKFNVCNDLAIVAKLKDPHLRNDHLDIGLFKPFTPMASQRVDSLAEAVRKMGGTFWIETKLDGERIEMHMRRSAAGANFEWYSRRATDYTAHYGDSNSEGALAPYIFGLFKPAVQSVILDGEMMAYNTETGIYEAFGSLKTASKEVIKLGSGANLRVCYVVFDIVHLNGKSLINEPLSIRYECLKSVFEEKKTYLEINPHSEGNTVADLHAAIDLRLTHHEEGIVVKNPRSVYYPAKKGGQSEKALGWLKIKPDYLDGYADDVDVLLVGGVFGEGNRGGVLASFMCAVKEESTDPEKPAQWLSFCKFGSGYKWDQLESIARQSEGIWRKYDPKKCPSWFVHPKNSKERPDMLVVSPDKAIVVQLKAFQIVTSDVYGAGWTLRFPTFSRIRTDKDLDSTLSMSGLERIIQDSAGRLQTKRKAAHATTAAAAAEDVKTTVARRMKSAAVKVGALHRAVDTSAVTKMDDLFRGLEMSILPGAGVRPSEAATYPLEIRAACADRQAIWQTVKRHGGNVVANASPKTTSMVIADQFTSSVSNLKNAGTHDVVKSRFILDCLTMKRLLPLAPRYMICTTDNTREKFKETVDKFGDSYTDDVGVATLKELFALMDDHSSSGTGTDAASAATRTKKRKRKSDDRGTFEDDDDDDNVIIVDTTHRTRRDTIAEIDERYFSMTPHEGGLFRRVRAYVDRYVDLRVDTQLLPSGEQVPLGTVRVDRAAEGSENENDTDDEDPALLATQAPLVPDSALDLTVLQIRARGGLVTSRIDARTTHVILDEDGETGRCRRGPSQRSVVERTKLVHAVLSRRRTARKHVVGRAWVERCIEVGRMVVEKEWELGVVGGGSASDGEDGGGILVVGGVGKASY
ncbi:DNA ligase (ATP) [Geranomyces variabilis]|uniref:DNA ligase n=1 Tax=Geranomyces variabilis TaxID=109894 RepID=A0AAD5XKC7_9FUNG|nr:DNA ligase (ATP) [Geranomyces variabilis]